MSAFKYLKYQGSGHYNSHDKCWHGTILNISDLVSYEADSLKNLEIEFIHAVEDYEETLKQLIL